MRTLQADAELSLLGEPNGDVGLKITGEQVAMIGGWIELLPGLGYVATLLFLCGKMVTIARSGGPTRQFIPDPDMRWSDLPLIWVAAWCLSPKHRFIKEKAITRGVWANRFFLALFLAVLGFLAVVPDYAERGEAWLAGR